jgi:hypothetical protein
VDVLNGDEASRKVAGEKLELLFGVHVMFTAKLMGPFT